MVKETAEVALWISKLASDSGASGIMVGLSGGIDSAVVLALCIKAVGKDNVIGLSMPCYSNIEDKADARFIAKTFGLPDFRILNLNSVYDSFTHIMHTGTPMARANLKARLRMCAIYFCANTYGYLVAGTCNKSEVKTGYFTKYGDGASDFEPIAEFYKREVNEMAIELGVPQGIIDRVPSAGLWEGQTDESEMGATYDEVEDVIESIDNHKLPKTDEMKFLKIEGLMHMAKHKTEPIPVFKRKEG